MSNGPTKSAAVSAWQSRLTRAMSRSRDRAETYNAVLRHLRDGPHMSHFKALDVDGPHDYSSNATLLFEVMARANVVQLLDAFEPLGMDLVHFQKRGQALWPSYFVAGPKNPVQSRESVVPFVYTVQRELKQAPRRTVSWIHNLQAPFVKADPVKVAILVDVAHDLSDFRLDHLEDTAHNQVLFRWVPNAYFPQGHRRGLWNRWSPTKGKPGALLTTYWKWSEMRGGPGTRWARIASRCLEFAEAEGGPNE